MSFCLLSKFDDSGTSRIVDGDRLCCWGCLANECESSRARIVTTFGGADAYRVRYAGAFDTYLRSPENALLIARRQSVIFVQSYGCRPLLIRIDREGDRIDRLLACISHLRPKRNNRAAA